MHGEVNFYITQFLSGHGGYRNYLYRFGLDTSPECPTCPHQNEDPEHVVFHCPRFAHERQQVEEETGTRLTIRNIIDMMTQKKENWDKICEMLKRIHSKLSNEEKLRKNMNG